MPNHNITIDLKPNVDRWGKTYYVAKIESPILIDCKDGVTFLVFVSEQGCESLQIAPMDNKRNSD